MQFDVVVFPVHFCMKYIYIRLLFIQIKFVVIVSRYIVHKFTTRPIYPCSIKAIKRYIFLEFLVRNFYPKTITYVHMKTIYSTMCRANITLAVMFKTSRNKYRVILPTSLNNTDVDTTLFGIHVRPGDLITFNRKTAIRKRQYRLRS